MRLFEERGLPRYLRGREKGQQRDPLPSPTSFLTLRYLLRKKNSSVTCPFLLLRHRLSPSALHASLFSALFLLFQAVFCSPPPQFSLPYFLPPQASKLLFPSLGPLISPPCFPKP